MAHDLKLAARIRDYLVDFPHLVVEEKKMFEGLAFMVNDKMCINVSGENLMCRFDPSLQETVAKKLGYQPMIMKGRQYQGYCYIKPEGFKNKKDFTFWINLCLEFNQRAKSSKK